MIRSAGQSPLDCCMLTEEGPSIQLLILGTRVMLARLNLLWDLCAGLQNILRLSEDYLCFLSATGAGETEHRYSGALRDEEAWQWLDQCWESFTNYWSGHISGAHLMGVATDSS